MPLFRIKPFRTLVIAALSLLATDLAVATTSGGKAQPVAQHAVTSVAYPGDLSPYAELRAAKEHASRSQFRKSHPQARPQVVHVVCWNGRTVVDHPNVQDCPSRPLAHSTDATGIPAIWVALKGCEAGVYGWSANTGNGFYGAFQITAGNAANYGFSRPDLLSPGEQLRLARLILRDQGVGAWPVCGPRVRLYPGA